jgi:hypothetical protein
VIAVSDGKVFDVASDGTFTQLTSAPTAYSSADPNGYLDLENRTTIVTSFLTDHPPDNAAHKVTLASKFDHSGSSFEVFGISNANAAQTETLTAGTTTVDTTTVLEILANEANGTALDDIKDTSFLRPKVIIATAGNVTVDSSLSPFPTGGSVKFPGGTNDILVIDDSPDWFMDTGAFTIDFWVRFSVLPTTLTGLWGQYTDANNNFSGYIAVAAGVTYVYLDVVNTGVTHEIYCVIPTPAVNTWYHLAFIRGWGGSTSTSGGWAITLNGTKLTNAGTVDNPTIAVKNLTTATFTIGKHGSGGDTLNGYISAFRVKKGAARWTANFTVDAVQPSITSFTKTGSSYFKKVQSITPTIMTLDSLTGFVTGATGAGPFQTIAYQPPRGFACKFYANNASADLSGIAITVVGTDIYGEVQTEIIATGPTTGGSVTGTKYFRTVSYVTIASTYGASTVDFGWKGGAGNFTYNGTYDFGWSADYTAPPAAGPVSGTPVVFDDGQTVSGDPWLYMASGNLTAITTGMVLYTPSDTNTPHATHVGWINGRFVANEPGTNKWDFTDTNPASGTIENDYWSATENPMTCEAKGDNLDALFCAFEEIYAWGSKGLEIWQDDGVTPFIPIQSAFTVAGIEGPYAYGKIDNTIFALCVIEGKRCIIRMNARSPVIVSEPIARVLADMSTVSDAFCDIISAGGISIALFSFPTAGESWAYDYKNDTWTRWGLWNVGTGTHGRFIGQHSCFAKTWNKHLIQSRIDGKIYAFDRSVYMDDTALLVSYRRTGWIDRGTFKRKRIPQLYVKVKTYVNTTTPVPILMVRWRDNGNPTWSSYAEIQCLLNSDYQGNFVFPLNRLGMYRSRQYEFRMTSNVDLVLVGVTEDVEVMRN